MSQRSQDSTPHRHGMTRSCSYVPHPVGGGRAPRIYPRVHVLVNGSDERLSRHLGPPEQTLSPRYPQNASANRTHVQKK